MDGKRTIDSKTVIVQSKDLVSSELDDEVILMSVARGRYYGMEGAGSRIWQLIAQPVSVSSLCASLCAEFRVDPETCLKDMLEYLNELLEENLVKIWDAPGD